MSIQEENIGSAANIQDAISKKHTSGADTSLGSQSENLNMNTHKIEGVVDPTTDQEAATKKYVDDNAVIGDGTVNPTNLLTNGNFELWTAGTSTVPDGWGLTPGAIARESTIIKQGTYSAKLTRSGSDCKIHQTNIFSSKGIDYWKSRTIIYSCWVYATVADRARLGFYDSSYSYSSYHTGNSTWQLLTLKRTIASDAGFMTASCWVNTGDTIAYFDGAMIVEGSSVFAFSPKPLPEVNPTVQGLLTLDEGQIKFPATQKASSDVNTLDDYEEGTFTPSITFGGGNIGVTYTANRYGRYTKIGEIVSVQITLGLSSKGSSTGSALITGLPFTTGLQVRGCAAIGYNYNISFANQMLMYSEPSTSVLNFMEVTEAGAITVLTDANFANDSLIMISMIYKST